MRTSRSCARTTNAASALGSIASVPSTVTASEGPTCAAGAPKASACLESYSVLTGNKLGPTKQGVNTLVGSPPRYEWVAPAQYKKVSDGKVYDMSENVVIAPIWDVCSLSGFCPDAKLSGTTPTLQMIGWGVLFIEGVDGNGVKSRLVNVTACGPGTNDEKGGTVLSLPLRLIRL